MVLNSFYIIIVVTVILFHYVACDQSEYLSGSKLVYWSSNNPYEIEFADYVVAKWNNLNPDKDVRSTGSRRTFE